MLSSVSNSIPATFDLPKPSLNSSKDTNLALQTVDLYSLHTEELYLKFKNPNGDMFELRAKYSEEIAMHSESTTLIDRFEKSIPNSKGTYSAKSGKNLDANSDPDPNLQARINESESDPANQAWAEVKAWAEAMKDELKHQQAALVKEILERQEPKRDQGTGTMRILHIMVKEEEFVADSAESSDLAPAPVPEYWNAENTSNRIVKMATGFAKISGLNPQEFGEKIRAAIEEGFSSAREITGELPGAAGKLNKDTHELVFTKLQKWLDDWQATAYNQTA